MGKCVVITGGMASGKTTLARELEKRGFRRIVTYTTRPKRAGEVDGVDYHFINSLDFAKKMNTGFFAEATVYRTIFGDWFYGSAKHDYRSLDNTIIVLNPQGVIALTEPAFIVYLDLRYSTLRERAIERGDSLAEIERRLAEDKPFFKNMLSIMTPEIIFKASSNVEDMADVVMYMIQYELRNKKSQELHSL
jgi:guanylate kinase